VPQTFTQPAAQDDLLVQIQPEALILLQARAVAEHLMAALLTFQHRHAPLLDAAPARLQAAPLVPIAREVLRISAATLPTHPVDFPRLPAAVAHCSLLASQLGGYLGFQQRFDYSFDRRCGCPFGSLVDFFQDGLPLVCFQFPLSKVYSQSADPSWWLSLVFFFTLPLGGPQLLFSAAFPPFSLPLERDTLPQDDLELRARKE
jgi:hypothetical protein